MFGLFSRKTEPRSFQVERMTKTVKNNSIMATDALAAMRYRQMMETIEAHLEARPDHIPSVLRGLAQRMDRLADRVERERNVG